MILLSVRSSRFFMRFEKQGFLTANRLRSNIFFVNLNRSPKFNISSKAQRLNALCFLFEFKEETLTKLNGNFTIIPNEFINASRLNVYEFRILCYLMKLSGCNSFCYPSYETTARETGMSLSKAKN